MNAVTPTPPVTPRTDSPLKQGNAALRAGKPEQAIAHYLAALAATPALSNSIAGNIAMARQKYRTQRNSAAKPRVAVCGWELSHNAAGRVYTLAMLYETFAEVEIIGSLFPQWGRQIWEPIRDTPIAKHSFVVEDEAKFIDQAIQLVAAHPYDIVHLSKPRAPNIFFGMLYKLIWDAKVLMDIDDEELAFVGEETPISVDDYLAQHGQLPDLQDLPGKDWTRLAVGLAKEFDGITVCNTPLQQRYGGEIIRHARDEKLFKPSPELKRKSREKYGIPQDKKVVLFFGTPREHKGLIETAQAIAELKRPDVLFCIAGDFADPSLKKKLQDIKGCPFVFLPNQPFKAIPEMVSVADCCVFMQDEASLAAKFQTPAKLTDALAMGVPVLTNSATALEGFETLQVVSKVTLNTLRDTLNNVLFDEALGRNLQNKSRQVFNASMTIGANAPKLTNFLKTAHSSEVDKSNLSKLVPITFAALPKISNQNKSSQQQATQLAFGSKPDVDVVVPVFNALEDVKRCMESLLRHADGLNVRVIVVNDGSDQPTTDWLRSYCANKPSFHLIEHAANSGYTKAVNTGLRFSTAPYVITQNSDTIVSEGWLKGLIRCMESNEKIGIVGPLSNAASWQNVPNLRDDTGSFAVNVLPDGMNINEMARLVARASTHSYPLLPFINGFCFMIRRAVIDVVGYMDEVNFPLGYGEENDFCIRAADSGFTLAVADDVYVFHAKSKSFGHQRRIELSKAGTAKLKKKHGTERFVKLVDFVGQTAQLDEVRNRIVSSIDKIKAAPHNKIPRPVDLEAQHDLPRRAGASESSIDMHGMSIVLWPVPAYGGREYDIEATFTAPVLVLPHQGIDATREQTNCDIGIHLHIYYEDLVDEFAYFLQNIRSQFSLYVSVVNPALRELVAVRLKTALPRARVEVECFPNVGRDIAPFLAGFGEKLRRHELIAHIHSKRSLHNPNKADWRRQLLANLFGFQGVVDGIIDLFSKNKRMGMVFPEYHHSLRGQISWGTNFGVCHDLAKRLDLDINERHLTLFPAGSMFWARSAALTRLFDLKLSWTDFPAEVGQVDGTIAHGVERLFGEIVVSDDFDLLQVKSDRPHNLMFYYPHKWPYHPKRSFEAINTDINMYLRSATLKGQKKCVIYSSLTGGYEQPVVHEKIDERCEYILFTDSPIYNRGFWSIRNISYQSDISVRRARWVKTNPHKLLAEYDIAIWIDANVVIRGDVQKYIGLVQDHPNVPLFGITHSFRRCIYDEASAVIAAKKDTEERVLKQINRYKNEGFPKNQGLIETNFLVINLKHPQTAKIFEAWSAEIEGGSHRDQLSLNYCLWKLGAKWLPIFEEKLTLRDSFDFAYLGHGRNSGYPKDIRIDASCKVNPLNLVKL